MKKSFLLFTDSIDIINELNDIEVAHLTRAILAHVQGDPTPKLTKLESVAFLPIKKSLDREAEKYERTVEKRRVAGQLGGLAKASKSKQVLAKPSKGKQRLANLADNDNVIDNDIENVKYKSFIEAFNRITGRSYKGDSESKVHFKARVKEGWTLQQIEVAISNAFKDKFLTGENENGSWYLAPEYILRSKQLDKWFNSTKREVQSARI